MPRGNVMRGTIRRSIDSEEIDCFYYPDVFNNVVDLEHAKRLTVTREGDLSSEMRWEVETKFTVDTLLSFVPLNKNSVVLDYGCGVGRLSKELIERINCSVIGVDISEKMRDLALDYVDRCGRFAVGSSESLRKLGWKFDCAIAVWVLQHCVSPEMDIDLIASVLKSKAYLFIMECFSRKIPIKAPSDSTLCWMDDGINVRELLLKDFDLVQWYPLNDGTYWSVYQRK